VLVAKVRKTFTKFVRYMYCTSQQQEMLTDLLQLYSDACKRSQLNIKRDVVYLVT